MTPLGWVLFALSTSVKALLVLTAAFGLTRLMRNRSASERHLVWLLASVSVIALPVLSLAGPHVRVRIPAPAAIAPTAALRTSIPAAAPRGSVEARVVPVEVTPPAAEATAVPVEVTPLPAIAPRPAATPRAGSAAVLPAAMAPGDAAPAATSRDGSALPVVVLLVWVAGALLLLARLAVGMMRVAALTGRARPLEDGSLVMRARDMASQAGVSRPVRLLEGDADAMPVTFGIVRATLLLPSAARAWPAARQDAVLRHELAHIRRRDSLSQLVVELGCALYWFNPLMWYASRRMCVEREHACDDAVLAGGSRASDYATELLVIARTLRSRPAPAVAAIAMARPSHLRERVASLLDGRARRDRTSTKLLVPAWIGAFLLITPLSSLAPELAGGLGRLPDERGGVPVDADTWDSPAPQAPYRSVKQRSSKEEPPTAATLSRGASPSDPAPFAIADWPGAGDAQTRAVAPSPVEVLSSLLRPVRAQAACLSDGRRSSISSNSNDSRRTIKWSGTDCSGEVLVEGDVEFNDDFTTITGISRGGQVRITTDEGGTERRVTIRPANGGVTYEYQVNGDRRDLDAAGQQWLSSTLTFMFRRLGFMAEPRAAAILRRGGPGALLAEVEQLQGDHVRSMYLTVLVGSGQLDAAALNRVLTLAGSTIDSDHYRTQIITAAAGRYPFTDAVRSAYISAVSDMDSDHYRHLAFSKLLTKGELTPAQVSTVLQETRRIESDHYRALLLDELASSYRATPAIRAAYLDAAASIASDHYKTNVLTKLFSMGGMTSDELARVVDATSTIDSDHYRSLVLDHVAQQDLTEATLQRAFVRAAADMDSDHYLQRVLSGLAARRSLDDATLMVLLESADGIDSDHYRSVLMIDIARRHRLQGAVRTRFERLMQDMESDTYRGRVAAALLSNGRAP